MPEPKIRLNLSTLGQLQQPPNPGIGWVGPERPAESWADIAADPLSALFDLGRGAVTGDAPPGMNLQGLGSVLAAALPVAQGAKSLRALTKAAAIEDAAQQGVRAYHGSPSSDLTSLNVPTNASEKAIFLTDRTPEARAFSRLKDATARPNVYEARIDTTGFHRVNYGDYSSDALYQPDVMEKILSDAADAGSPGVVINGIRNFEGGRETTTYAVFDKRLIDIARKFGVAAAIGLAASKNDR